MGIAFSDIVDNAVKYAVAGEIMLSAKLDAQGDLLISVSDEGPGLSSEMTGRIFNLYERGEQGAKTPGFGLGLWVARRVAVLHGGDLSVSTSEKGGACFTLKLSRRFE
ncbi:Sensor protein KdpD [bioreactor metagenome]|uniref:histidine kinase n=1 Tax=bioreactor metagenome TaxID=1076179 RepID=A0A645G392_9ZZZZ